MAARRRRRKTGLLGLLSAITDPVQRPMRRRWARRSARSTAARTITAPTTAARTKQPRTPPVRQSGLRKRLTTRRAAGHGTLHAERYAGSAGSRGYQIYLPAGLPKTSKVPLILMLHGCRQTPAEFAAATRFDELADRNTFIVVYPEQTVTHNLQRCWNWFDIRHQGRGHGEPAILAGIARQVMAERSRWRIDNRRIYVAGLSAGGAMALVLGATYPDLFAGIGVHSAPPYRSASSRAAALGAMAGRPSLLPASVAGVVGIAPMVVFQGRSDPMVRSVNSLRIVDQWRSFHERGLSGPRDPKRLTRRRESVRTTDRGRRYTVTRWYSANGRKMLESWQIDQLAHAWSGGRPGVAFSDPHGPRASTAMWHFLSAHRLDHRPA